MRMSQMVKLGARYVDITEEQQALKVIQLTGIRCSNPNRVAQFINEKLKVHNLADMWQALCAVVDGPSDRQLLLAVDAASYEAYMRGRRNRQATLKGVAMSMKVEECRWGTVMWHIAKDQATPISRTRLGKGGDPAINFIATGDRGISARLLMCTMSPWKHTMPFISLWGMGEPKGRGTRALHTGGASHNGNPSGKVQRVVGTKRSNKPVWPVSSEHKQETQD